ncbi:hypothetical protein LJC24_02075 [Desulfococcaceae bacterium OttesenSCG-928-F15]|nr:hypothetical protein [Desulfococcaceae bacterium OttesenSCG-928-F15]
MPEKEKLGLVVKEVLKELKRCEKGRTWYKDPQKAVGIVMEEALELLKAVNDYTEEKQSRVHPESFYPSSKLLKQIREEAVQTAAMAIRFLYHMHEYR